MASETSRPTGRSEGNGRRSGPESTASDGAALKPPGYFEGETITRRRMFTGGAMALGGIAGAAIGLPAIGFALGPVFHEVGVHYQDVGSPDDFNSDTFVPRVITITFGVGEAGKSTIYVRKGNSRLGEDPKEFVAISTRCAHAGCPVRWFNDASRFICPCHGGVYDIQGKVTGGPPVRPLDRFFTRVQGGRVEIGPRYSVNSQLKRFHPRDPGEHLDGVWKFLYPRRPTTPFPH
jgi:menaquinol-cytochrome c reductase iron-sulfur subunit